MKKNPIVFGIALASVVVGLSVLQSCNKLSKLVQYDLEMQTADVEVVIPPVADTNATYAGTQTNYYNVDSFIKANTNNILGLSNITSAKITSCVVTMQSPPAGISFGNFKSVNASFFTNGNTTPFVVAIANNPDVNTTTLNIPVDSNADLRPYFNGNNYTYAMSGSLRRAITDTVKCKVQLKYKIHVEG